MLFSIVAAPIYIPISSAQGFPLLHLLVSTCYLFHDTLTFFFFPMVHLTFLKTYFLSISPLYSPEFCGIYVGDSLLDSVNIFAEVPERL